LDFLCELYYDVWIHKHQVKKKKKFESKIDANETEEEEGE